MFRIRDPEKIIPDPWGKKAPDPDPQRWIFLKQCKNIFEKVLYCVIAGTHLLVYLNGYLYVL
jgi:hypothetical protein